MAIKKRGRGRSRKTKRRVVSSSEDSSSDSSDDSSSVVSSSSESDSSLSESDSSSSSDSSSESDSDVDMDDFDESRFPDEDPKKTVEEIREIIRDAKVMKYENALIERGGIDNYAAMRDLDERKLKRLGMGYTDRERLINAFRSHVDQVVEKNREKWERQKQLKKHKTKPSSKKKGGKSTKKSKAKSKSSRGSKSSKRSKKSTGSKSSKNNKSSAKGKSSKSTKSKKPEIDPDEALRRLDTGWSGKKQAWADYKLHEARVVELLEFYDEIGKKRASPEEHARKLLCSYPGGINKLVIALDKKYHHIPYGWEDLLEEAYRLEEFEGSESN